MSGCEKSQFDAFPKLSSPAFNSLSQWLRCYILQLLHTLHWNFMTQVWTMPKISFCLYSDITFVSLCMCHTKCGYRMSSEICWLGECHWAANQGGESADLFLSVPHRVTLLTLGHRDKVDWGTDEWHCPVWGERRCPPVTIYIGKVWSGCLALK